MSDTRRGPRESGTTDARDRPDAGDGPGARDEHAGSSASAATGGASGVGGGVDAPADAGGPSEAGDPAGSRRTRRWRGVVAVSLGAVALALLANQPGVLVVAVLGVVFAAYPQMTRDPEPALSVDRTLSDPTPGHGEDVEVTVTVENTGDGWVVDGRVLDGVPPVLPVVAGSPRHGVVLRPGGTSTFSYTVRAKRGRHSFDEPTVIARDLSGGREVETTADDADAELDCANDLDSAPLRGATMEAAGRVLADQSGSGLEFDRTRTYQPGDAMRRIDWNRLARTGELTTVEYREEQAATVMLVVDARSSAYRGVPRESHAVADSVAAARQLVGTLAGSRSRVGVAGLGRELAWLAPGAGREHTERVQRLLRTHPTFASTPPGAEPDHDAQVEALRARLPANAQVVLLSPLTDDEIVATARRLDAHGHPVSVVSPEVTATDTAGQRLAVVERRNRLSRLRSAGVPVAEWPADAPLAAAVDGTRGDVV